MKLTIIYDPVEGVAIPDGSCESTALKYIAKGGTYVVSSELLIAYVRQAIANELISAGNVTFCFKGQVIYANNYGAIQNWPEGFCDYQVNVCESILRRGIAKRNLERQEKKA